MENNEKTKNRFYEEQLEILNVNNNDLKLKIYSEMGNTYNFNINEESLPLIIDKFKQYQHEKFKQKIETTNSIWGIEDLEVLEPTKFGTENQILFERSEDSEHGTYPLVMHYVTLAIKIDSESIAVWLNRISNHKSKTNNKLNIDYNCCQIIREHEYDTKAILRFKQPIDVLITYIGDKPIIEKVSEIQGEFVHEFYWTKDGRQNKIANGFEVWFQIEKYLK